VDEVGERLRAVDLDHRKALAIAALELGIAGDVDLLEVEGNLGPDCVQDAPGALAQVAARRVVYGDAPPGYG
jgi:hypothetical protein